MFASSSRTEIVVASWRGPSGGGQVSGSLAGLHVLEGRNHLVWAPNPKPFRRPKNKAQMSKQPAASSGPRLQSEFHFQGPLLALVRARDETANRNGTSSPRRPSGSVPIMSDVNVSLTNFCLTFNSDSLARRAPASVKRRVPGSEFAADCQLSCALCQRPIVSLKINVSLKPPPSPLQLNLPAGRLPMRRSRASQELNA